MDLGWLLNSITGVLRRESRGGFRWRHGRRGQLWEWCISKPGCAEDCRQNQKLGKEWSDSFLRASKNPAPPAPQFQTSGLPG